MRLPDAEFTERPWRIHEFTRDFELEDVWALDTPGGPDDLAVLVEQMSGDGEDFKPSPAYRFLFAVRWWLGRLLGWDQDQHGVGARHPSLRDRLPPDLRDGPRGPDPQGVPMSSVYQTSNEWVTELGNRTVQAAMHLGWVPDGQGGYYAQMAVLVKKNDWLGRVYMPLILPLRRVFVYPSLLKALSESWQQRQTG
jgi:hypothetical protein